MTFKNQQQLEALLILTAFVSSKDFEEIYSKTSTLQKINPNVFPENRLVVNGSAGVGKTWLIKQFIDYCRDKLGYSANNIVVAALTNQAKSLLEREVKGMATVKTLAQLYKLRPTYDKLGNLKYETSKATSSISSSNMKLIVVDEASQYDMFEYETFLNDEVKIVYLGDTCQTPPIGSSKSDVFKCRGFTLDRPIRFDDSIGKPLSPLRKGILSNTIDRPFKLTTTLDNGKGIGYLPNKDFIKSLVEDFKVDPLETKLLCYTNKGVDAMNQILKKQLSPSKETFSEGDVCIAYNSVGSISNGDNIKLKDVKYGIKIHNISEISKDIVFEDTIDIICGTFAYNDTDSKEVRFIYDELELKKFNTFRAKVGKLKSLLYSKVSPEIERSIAKLGFTIGSTLKNHKVIQKCIDEIDFKLNKLDTMFLNIKLGYAMTVHKSQGMGFNNIYVYSKDVETCLKYDKQMYGKLLYTACTRSKQKVILSNDKA